jgi:NADPH:quinone reductase-like Zn-dependent oxidoreductase
MEKMKAVRIHAYGGRETLTYEDAPLPEVREGDLLVHVHATSVNPFEWKVRQGYLAGWINYSFPLTLGWDVSGVVEAGSQGVNGFKPGDPVFGRADISRNGAYAEYIAIPASLAAHKPQSVDHLHAAAVPHAALAAWRALFTAAELAPGQTVLIHAAAGGVGHIAVQLAKWRGAQVIGTASGPNLAFLKELGVDQAIDYTTTRFEEAVREVDVVLDNVGGETLQRSWGVLKPGGMLVSLVEPPSPEKAAETGVRAILATADPDPEILTRIAGLVDAGRLRPVVSTVFPLSQMPEAHALSESYHTRGKIGIKVVE